MKGEELIGLPFEVTFGFIRVATNPRLGSAKVSLTDARRVVQSWFDLPQARVLTPSGSHFSRVMELMTAAMATGPLLTDAILAAFAIEHRATLFTNDGDFERFPGLKWENPLLSE
jgi:toxin-antitoxin system PIN domain toxin